MIVYVAAADATDEEKGKADFVCDGVNDSVAIRKAIKHLDNCGGGSLRFTGGHIDLADNNER